MATASAGLCTSCLHAQAVPSARGSTFLLCELSRTDPRFPRYPRLPVVACAGYERGSGRAPADEESTTDAS